MFVDAGAINETSESAPVRIMCDASVTNQRVSSIGVVIVNHSGWTADVECEDIGTGYSTIEAECEAMQRALDALRATVHVQHVNVYTDCEPALKAIRERDGIRDGYEYVSFAWVPREDNRVADAIADMA
jgi:RNase H.